MKRFVLSVLTVLTCGALQALPAGNPADASLYTNNFWFGDASSCDPCDPCGSWCDWFDWRLGFYGDYVYNRHLKTRANNNNPIAAPVMETSIFTNAGLIALDVCDWLEAFGTVGVSNFYIRTTANVWRGLTTSNEETEVFFAPSMSYSGGLRATIWQCDNFYVGGMAQYFYSNTEIDAFLAFVPGTVTHFNTSRSGSYQEWQVAIGAAYSFMNSANFAFVPYANVEVSGVNWDLQKVFTVDQTYIFQTLRENKVVGWSLGLSAILCDLVGVTVEGRWANEKAIHVNGQLSF